MTCITRISNFLHLELRLASRLHLAFRVMSCISSYVLHFELHLASRVASCISSYILRPELRLAFRVASCVSSCVLRQLHKIMMSDEMLIFRIFNAAQ